jgi:hypothetical protein
MLRAIFNFFFRAKKFRIKFNRYTQMFELQKAKRFGYETIEVFEEREQAEQKLKLC